MQRKPLQLSIFWLIGLISLSMISCAEPKEYSDSPLVGTWECKIVSAPGRIDVDEMRFRWCHYAFEADGKVKIRYTAHAWRHGNYPDLGKWQIWGEEVPGDVEGVLYVELNAYRCFPPSEGDRKIRRDTFCILQLDSLGLLLEGIHPPQVYEFERNSELNMDCNAY